MLNALCDAILRQVYNQYGITLHEVMTGGGCMALESRLESGHWIVATDEMLCGFKERVELENGGATLGWFIGVYPHNGDDSGWFGVDSIIEVSDYDARAQQLTDMIGKALAELAEHHSSYTSLLATSWAKSTCCYNQLL